MSVRQISEVRKLQRDGTPIKEISRRVGVSRNTVRKILRGKETKFVYDRSPEKTPIRGPIMDLVRSWLKEDLQVRPKYRRTAKRMYDIMYCNHGYQGSYSTVRRCVKAARSEIQRQNTEVFIPLSFEPGSATQFD